MLSVEGVGELEGTCPWERAEGAPKRGAVILRHEIYKKMFELLSQGWAWKDKSYA